MGGNERYFPWQPRGGVRQIKAQQVLVIVIRTLGGGDCSSKRAIAAYQRPKGVIRINYIQRFDQDRFRTLI